MESPNDKRDRVLKEALECRVDLVAYARALLGDFAEAEDAVQETMLVVVKKFEQFQEGTSMLAWCRSMVRLEVLRMKQKRRRERTLAERLLDDAVDAAFAESKEVRQHDDTETWRSALERCLAQISERGRRILKARFIDGVELSSDRRACRHDARSRPKKRSFVLENRSASVRNPI